MRVLVVGAASWNTVLHVDALPDGRPGRMVAHRSYDVLGGTAAGKAVNLAALGHEVHLHTLLGDDEAGARVRAVLVDAGVHLHADRDVGPTERHVNLMPPDGSRLSVYRSVMAPTAEFDVAQLVALAETCDAVVLNITDYVRRLVGPLVAHGIPFWTDLHGWDGVNPHHADFADAATWTVLSDEAGTDQRAVVARLLEHARLVVVTRGSRGAVAESQGRRYEVPAHPVDKVVDTNGAGDAFTAGLLHGLHAGWPFDRALRAGAVAGALSVMSETLASRLLSAELLDRETAAPAGSAAG